MPYCPFERDWNFSWRWLTARPLWKAPCFLFDAMVCGSFSDCPSYRAFPSRHVPPHLQRVATFHSLIFERDIFKCILSSSIEFIEFIWLLAPFWVCCLPHEHCRRLHKLRSPRRQRPPPSALVGLSWENQWAIHGTTRWQRAEALRPRVSSESETHIEMREWNESPHIWCCWLCKIFLLKDI